MCAKKTLENNRQKPYVSSVFFGRIYKQLLKLSLVYLRCTISFPFDVIISKNSCLSFSAPRNNPIIARAHYIAPKGRGVLETKTGWCA